MSDLDDARDQQLYVEDILGFGQRVAAYAHGMDQEAFVADGRTYDATLRNIGLIGEAATHVPARVRQAYPLRAGLTM